MVLELLCSQDDLSCPQEIFPNHYYLQPPQISAAETMSALGICINAQNHPFVDDNNSSPHSEIMHLACSAPPPYPTYMQLQHEDKFLHFNKDPKYCIRMEEVEQQQQQQQHQQQQQQRASRSSSDSCEQILGGIRSKSVVALGSPSTSSSWFQASDEVVELSNGKRKCRREGEGEMGEGKQKEGVGNWKKRKRKRGTRKTREQVESQRMNHIAVERNRRRQMNEHLSVMRALMPQSYINRGDQASIIGGAIEFVKELEQILQSLLFQKMQRDSEGSQMVASVESNGESSKVQGNTNIFEDMSPLSQQLNYDDDCKFNCTTIAEFESSTYNFNPSKAHVEVKMIGSWAIVKVLAHKQPHQLLNALLGLQKLCLKVMHLNVTTSDQIVLYSFHIEVNGGSRICHVDDITKSIQSVFAMPSCMQ